MDDKDSGSEDESDERFQQNQEILASVFRNYQNGKDFPKLNGDYGQNDAETSAVLQKLANSLRKQSCLVCLYAVAKTDPIWSCNCCFTKFHLVCIQKWVREGVHQAQIRHEGDLNDLNLKEFSWCCPKCRTEYHRDQCPTKYLCFCGKSVNPKPDLWLPDHSCGEVCGKQLNCQGQHSCLLLCHGGPCAPCAKQLQTKCFCGKKGPEMKRCGASGWSCQQSCGRLLSCNVHRCSKICHSGSCPPCDAKSEQVCQCGRQKQIRSCTDPKWQCGEICGKLLSCSKHYCKEICHSGKCEPCVPADQVTCPCEKTKFDHKILCVDEIPTCGDTCGKILDCNHHFCVERCHKSVCPMCIQTRLKICRCGAKEKLVQCSKEFLCDTKCKRKRQCERHFCSRRCCDGNCPSCEQICGRTLTCQNHKCQSVCHQGICYPCPLSTKVFCRCGGTYFEVPCGKERGAKPPRCRLPCHLPAKCHHKEQNPHRCHFGECPTCVQICGKTLKCCHSCLAVCHSAVFMNTNEPKQKPATPWERPEVRMEFVNLPCPPCKTKVPVRCLGGHEISEFFCCDAKIYSCGRKCGKMLTCGNDSCENECHSNEIPCDRCEKQCSLPRAKDCTHPCLLACHPAPCAPCKQMYRIECYCGIGQRYIRCDEWSKADEEKRALLRQCENRCPKLMDGCGHRCMKICHSGTCSDRSECTKKITVFCACKLRKAQIQCRKAPELIDCDAECEKAALEAASRRSVEEQSELRRRRSQSEDQEELERKFGEKKKWRKKNQTNDGQSRSKKNIWGIVGTVSVLIFIVSMLFWNR